jgi:type II secretion system protein C
VKVTRLIGAFERSYKLGRKERDSSSDAQETAVVRRIPQIRAWQIAGFTALGAAIGLAASLDADFWKLIGRSAQEVPTTTHVANDRSGAVSALPASIPAHLKAAFPSISDSTVRKDLILTGTVLGRNLNEGRAFIGIDESNPQTYSAGAILANGARLSLIAKDYVVLEKDGQSVRLYQQTVKHRSVRNNALLRVGGTSSSEAAPANYVETFSQFIRVNPIYAGDALRGYEVYPGRRSAVFSRLGLRSGDVITALDGSPITDGEAAMQLLEQLATGVAMSATVDRKGTRQIVGLDGALLRAEIEEHSRDASLASAQSLLPR